MMELYWPTPATVPAARFVVSEIGETVDAFLRQDSQYARNRERSPEVLDEMADTAMMILTAMGRNAPVEEWAVQWADEEYGLWDVYEDLDEIDALVLMVKDFYACAVVPHPSPGSLAGFGGLALWRISEYPGMDLEARLLRRLDRIFRKHHPDGQRLVQLERERNGIVLTVDAVVNGIVYQSETPGLYGAEDFAGYHPA
jgi:hypothetical protein